MNTSECFQMFSLIRVKVLSLPATAVHYNRQHEHQSPPNCCPAEAPIINRRRSPENRRAACAGNIRMESLRQPFSGSVT